MRFFYVICILLPLLANAQQAGRYFTGPRPYFNPLGRTNDKVFPVGKSPVGTFGVSYFTNTPAGGGGGGLPQQGSLIHYWKFSEAAGSDRNDSIGTVHMVEVGGNVPSVTGKNGQGVQGGANDLSTSVTDLAVGSGGVQTFAFWVKFNSLPPTTRYGCFRHAIANHPLIEYFSDGTMKFARNPSPVVLSLALGTVGDWHFVVLVTNGTTWSASIDNSALSSAAGSTLQSFAGGAEFIYVTEDLFDGVFDEFGIWNAALTQGEINTLWNGGAGLFLP